MSEKLNELMNGLSNDGWGYRSHTTIVEVDDLFDQAAKEASKKFPDADFIEVKAVKSKQGDILLEN